MSVGLYVPTSILRAITRHSAIPVSDEKDISLPLAAMLKTVRSMYSVPSICLKFCQASPEADDSGKTKASTPPGLSLRCANAANAEAMPFGFQFLVEFLEGVGDVFQEDEGEDDVLVFCGVDVASEGIGSSPEL